ncbi:hypothetical protein SARC_02390 [Sphaeroforma arctica JP610]|uniref:Homoaconitase, mitochondrial n=1 Tax=Sphaeroforma arctica JP610 TaxID=667725 RepID=A0A0L0G8W1_9EUKA|nr:hypothetical protein SARC_02390 [Sphaeroforma arctica JP610]KNC85440.1 hypothetical protein SARC_02390 [Sphaeroforma arctica JP610]|eukprot:XP_014159342.1 hypothetical protein SARC_02390 [Sphaeroforma arctica JP610]
MVFPRSHQALQSCRAWTRGFHSTSIHNGQNYVEKIAQTCAVGLEEGAIVKSGDFVSICPTYVMTHDNTAAVMKKFNELKVSKMSNPSQVVNTLDHNVQDKSDANLKKYADIQAFAKGHGVDFYPAGRGIGHQVMCEEGYVTPYAMVVASDSHSNMYGGLGALGTPVVRTDAAAIWATSRTWWQVPKVTKVQLEGKLNGGVTGKDLIITLCGHFNKDEVLNHAVEFTGPGVTALSVDDRLTLANMTTEWGALAGVFAPDSATFEWLEKRTRFVALRGPAGVPSDKTTSGEWTHPRLNETAIQAIRERAPAMAADADAHYDQVITIDLSTVSPHISGPNHVKVMSPISEMMKEKKKVHKAYLVSCVNSRASDIAAAAAVVRGKQIHEDVDFYVAAASSEVEAAVTDSGDWQSLMDAGAKALPPGCGPCIGLGAGLLEDGEVGISATNRNFKGRMGSRNAEAYLASPAVVASSALAGYITSSPEMEGAQYGELVATLEKSQKVATETPSVTIDPAFPASMTGNILFCHQDNINTDGIYPGKYTYREDISPEDMAKVAMENYDTGFQGLVQQGDILVGGFNFGSGSSREQAATCLKYAGIQLLIAGSFSETFKRNALNNGVLVIEIPELVSDLRSSLGESKNTARTPEAANISFANSTIKYGSKTYTFSPVGAVAQELILVGGLENWVKKQI